MTALPTKKSDTKKSALPRIRHLLIVTGASGAGKSTFLRALASGNMQADIRAMLPPHAETWTQRSAGESVSWLAETAELHNHEAIPGVVLHYDMLRGLKKGDYHLDPALRLFHQADVVTIVNLRPPPERLARQLAYHTAVQRAVKGKSPPTRLRKLLWRIADRSRSTLLFIAKAIPPRLLSRFRKLPLVAPAWNKLIREANRSSTKEYTHYDRPGWLDELYEAWAAYLRSATPGGMTINQIYLQPHPDSRVGKDFRWQTCT